ncbi:hypothetical protein CFOL_v3_26259, partial [Cephalotus follicularis]
MLMAADQLRKRLNGANMAGCGSSEQYRMKKKKLESPESNLYAKSHISLEWDGIQKTVVAKKEQISISWRDLRPFIDSVPYSRSFIADVLSIPEEIFELDNLTEVISYEVWQTHLSENERNNLMRFLPRGKDAEHVVQALLDGDNFHFGNPFFKWQVNTGASLCSGNLHPDRVLHQEQGLKADKEAYYSELQNYHNDVIEYLQKLKKRWESCKDPEKEIVQEIWRPRKEIEKRISSCADESRIRGLEQDVTATSESFSWVADEKACSSDNQYSSVMKAGAIHKRMTEKCFLKEKSRNLIIVSDDVPRMGARPKNGDKLRKSNITHSDGAKYMSYFKISKTQHQLVKSMKQSGKSIQSGSLNRVLGSLDGLNVQPYEVFVQEERKKLHEHWLQLANEHLPAAHANWRSRQLQRWEMIKSLEQDMKEKLNLVEDEEKENSEHMLLDHQYNGETNFGSNLEVEENAIPGSPLQISSVNDCHELNTMDVESENNHHVTSKSDDASSDVSEALGNWNTADVTVTQGAPHSSGGDIWPAVSIPHSYYDSAASHEYSAARGLSLMQQQEQRSRLIDLESDLQEEDTGKDIIRRQSDDGSFTSYPNQDRSELLQSFFKGQEVLSYQHEQNRSTLDFQPPNNVLMEDGQFPGHFQESSLPLEPGLKSQSNVYMQQNILENIYSDGGRYFIPRQENLPPGNVQDWTINPVRLPSHLDSVEILSQNWYSRDHQVRGGWSGSNGVSVPTQSMGSGTNADQGLYSILSHCGQLHSGSPYDSMGPSEQILSSRNYNMMGGTPNHGLSNTLPQVSHPLNHSGGRDAATSLMPDDVGWINLQHQNSLANDPMGKMHLQHQNPAIHDPMGKPYLRSWNQ